MVTTTAVAAPRTIDAGTRMAAERTRLAHERTLMAWVRTATSLIAFGFTTYKFFEFEAGKGVPVPASLLSPRAFALFMIGTGLVALLLSVIEHRRDIRALQIDFDMPRHGSVAGVVAGIIALLGLLSFSAALVGG